MMATDEERREVAGRLRGPFDVTREGRYYHLNGTLFSVGIYAATEHDLRNGMHRLADLIEPQEQMCSMKCGERGIGLKGYTCNECGETRPAHDTPRYCPNCGAKVVSE